VTEAEWLAATDPKRMLEFLRDKVGDRKLRLFACDYCRTVRGTLRLGPGPAVAVAERYADGLAGDENLASERRGVPFPDEFSEWVLAPSAYDGAWQGVDWLTSVRDIMKIDSDAYRHFPVPADDVVSRSVLVLRDIFGDPFRPAPAINAAWLAWHDGAVSQLARAAYEDRRLPEGTLDPARMAVLADALEDAGCSDPELLGHMRSPGPHVRGCWAVDLVLGKE
jgi:hypothetical protein